MGLALVIALKLDTSVTRGLKLKVRKLLGLILTLIEVTEKRLVGGLLKISKILFHPVVSKL